MNEDLFGELVSSRGDDYRRRRDALLARADAESLLPPFLSALDWTWSACAEALSFWRAEPDVARNVADLMTGAVPRRSYVTGSPAPFDRGQRIAALGDIVTPRVIELLWFERPWPDVESLSALLEALIELQAGRAAPPLLALADSLDGEPAAQELIVEALGRMRIPAGTLLVELISRPTAGVAPRRMATRWCAVRGERAALPSIQAIVEDAGASRLLRADAAAALARLDPALAIDVLVPQLAREQDEYVAERIADALAAARGAA